MVGIEAFGGVGGQAAWEAFHAHDYADANRGYAGYIQL